MAYIRRIVETRGTRESKKMFTSRVHTKGTKRKPHTGSTSEKQAKINEHVSEEQLRWAINGNFRKGDYHLALHYYNKELTFEEFAEHGKRFLRELYRLCRKKGIPFRYVWVMESNSMTRPHHHIILNRMDMELIEKAWAWALGGTMEGAVSFQLLDNRGNHFKLAHYLMKESRATMKRYKEQGKRGRRYSTSQNLAKPKITYEKVSSSSWRKEPKPSRGAHLYKFEDGSTTRSGWHEVSGYPYQEYFEIFTE